MSPVSLLMTLHRKKWFDWVIGSVLGLIAFVVYTATHSDVAYPGESATLIVQHTDLSPFATPMNPIWGFLARNIARGNVSNIASRLSILSAFCGALAIIMMYRVVVASIMYFLNADAMEERKHGKNAARLGGIVAALFVALSVPFWIVSNRAHTAPLGVLLFLSVVYLFIGYVASGSQRSLLAFAMLYGIGTVEFATFTVFAPFFAAVFLLVSLRDDTLKTFTVLKVLGCYLVGLLFYVFVAWRFSHTFAFEISGFETWHETLRYMLKYQYNLIMHSLPRTGWLIIIIVTAAPWLVHILVASRALSGESDWSYFILHIVLTAITVLVLFNLSLSPWAMLGMRSLLVTPYVLAAWVFGYLAAYWYLVPHTWSVRSGQLRNGIKHTGSCLLGALMLGAVVVAAFRNAAVADARPTRHISQYLEYMLDSLSGRTWLVTDGTFDHELRILARQRNVDLTILSLAHSQSEAYMNYVASLFRNPRLKSLSAVGLRPTLQKWLMTEPGAADKLAIAVAPDIWFTTGMIAVPNKMLFLGRKDMNDLDPTQLLNDHAAFWDEYVPLLRRTLRGEQSLAYRADYILRHLALVANDLGVLLQDMDKTREARTAYSRARGIDPDNISARLNLLAIAEQDGFSQEARSLEAELTAITSDADKKHCMWFLSSWNGYVWFPQVFESRNWQWVLSGSRPMTLTNLEKTMNLAGNQTGNLKDAVAKLYLEQNDDAKSEQVCLQILESDPQNVSVLTCMARISARRNNLEAMESFLEKAGKAGAPETTILLERAVGHSLAGKAKEARTIIEDLLRRYSDYAPAWVALAHLLVHTRELDALDRCRRNLERANRQDLGTAFALAEIASATGDFSSARRYYGHALSLRPSVLILEKLLQLDVREMNRTEAARHVRQILNLDPDNSFATYFLGTFQVERKEYALAEASFRHSMKTLRTPEVLNDLAWVLHTQGKHQEALEYATESVKLNRTLYQSWDTLGSILIAMDKYDRAEKSLAQATAIAPDDPAVLTHTAELYEKTGRQPEALELVLTLLDRKHELSDDRIKLLETMRGRLKR